MHQRLTIIAALLACVSAASAVSTETVPVGNPENAADMRYNLGRRPEGYGRVNYTYHICKFEVTAGQYCEFLNAVASTDTYGLYNTSMDTAAHHSGCNIKRTGSSGNYSYSVSADWANRPANFVSWGDAARFCNWLTNGHPTGAQDPSTTEDGSYFLDGATTNAALMAVIRKPNAQYVIPTEDEWYKPAYHKNDGVTGNYWDYPTGTNNVPSNVLGNPTDPGNNATFWNNVYTIGNPYYRTEAGAHENSESPYGTFDQGGNVQEWNETVVPSSSRPFRGLRGGSFDDFIIRYEYLSAGRPSQGDPAAEVSTVGFRIAIVPEPATLSLLALGGLSLLPRRR